MTECTIPLPLSVDGLVSVVQTATKDVFTTMLGIEVSLGEVFIEKATAVTPVSGVISLIGLAGTWVGTGSISCSVSCACRVAQQFLSSEYPSINEEVLDAIAEITNMVIGNVKTALEEALQANLGLSTPTVIFGRNFQTRSSGTQQWIVLPFEFDAEQFYVQLCLAPNRDTSSKNLRPGFALPQVVSV